VNTTPSPALLAGIVLGGLTAAGLSFVQALRQAAALP
jgi:hypothetical protein